MRQASLWCRPRYDGCTLMLHSSVGVIRCCLFVCSKGMVEKFESVVTTIVWAPTAGAGTEETTLKLQIIGGPILEVTSQLA